MTTTRQYQIGDRIPGRGTVVRISSTAYGVMDGVSDIIWVPFYGPNGVDNIDAVEGLVTFSDGSRYGSPK